MYQIHKMGSFGGKKLFVLVKTRADGRYELIILDKRPAKTQRIKKFVRGPKIKSISALARQITRSNYVFWGNRPCHWSWLGGMSLFTLNGLVYRGIFHYARLNPKYPHQMPF